MPIERVITTREFAKLFHVEPSTVRSWVRQGFINPIANTRPYKFPESEIEKRQKQKQTVDIFA
jgi:DNA-binding transcriptional MerR regulator